MRISLDKEGKEVKEKRANSQRNIYNNNIKSKIIYKLNQKNNILKENNYSEEVSLEDILNNNYTSR